jgi:uncharacterized protein
MDGEPVYWLLVYDVVDQYIERRAPFRPAHLALAQAAHGRGELMLAGAFGDPVEGAVLVFTADDVSVVEAFVREDPYVRNGLVTAWKIRRWNVVIGPPAQHSGSFTSNA